MAPRGRRRRGKPVHGWLLIDKPMEWTSSDVVNKVRRHLNAQKAGHGGTLDPMATGLLAIAFGEATKTVGYALHGRKGYDFSVRFGQATSTDDAEGEVVATSDVRPSAEAIEAALPAFVGDVMQRPPAFSAIKVDGQRAYDLARAGEVVELEARPVICHGLAFQGFEEDGAARLRVDCGPGYYVRSLARDLAEAVGSVGHVTRLRRDRVAGLTLDNAIRLKDFLDLEPEEAIQEVLQPIEAVLDDIPAVTLSLQEAQLLRQGQPVRLLRKQDRQRVVDLSAEAAEEEATVVALADGRAVALATVEGPTLKPLRVFNT